MTLFIKATAACALIILACVGTLSFWNELRNEEDRAWVTHTLFVVEKLQSVRIDITQAETGQRGFILTGQDRHLALYEDSVSQLNQDLKDLAHLTGDNSAQEVTIEGLNPLIADRLTELAEGIEIRKRRGLQAGIEAAARANHGEKSMEVITAQIDEMRKREEKLLTRRLDTAAASTRKMKIVIVGGNALGILVLLVAGVVLSQETSRRNLAEQNLKRSNESLERRTGELSETNTELESFTYSVAHDLRAPLRHIAGFSNLLLQNYGPRLDAEGLRLIWKIEEGARKMGNLVDDLLRLSKIGAQQLSIQDTSLDSLLAQVVEDFLPECKGREVEWRTGELFSVECDPALMKQVFVNLLSNAVKYTGKREHAVIQVGQTQQNGERVIFVQDNGTGFDMQYAAKLFGVFQRLHKARDFEGTGVGLAIVQRIIRKHGGRIWAEAALDQGSTFFFTIGSPEEPASNQNKVKAAEEQIHVA
jgi:signal transduction histidine kinase